MDINYLTQNINTCYGINVKVLSECRKSQKDFFKDNFTKFLFYLKILHIV